MKTLFSLGAIFPSDFLKPDEQPRCEPIELKLVMEDNGLVHLEKTAPKEVMWGKYWYISGATAMMRKELKSVVNSILPLMEFKKGEIWCDIACNEGTLLRNIPKSFIRIGIDPADDTYKKQSEECADFIIQDYFSAECFKKSKYGNRKVKVVTSIAMFYDVDNPTKFISDVSEILEDDGLWVMQLSYSPLMCIQNAFDNIVHEHWAYYNLTCINMLLNNANMKIVDCQFNDANGGSMRVYIMKSNENISKFGTQPYRDVCNYRINSALQYESFNGFNDFSFWEKFYKRICDLKKSVIEFITLEKEKGKIFYCYAASTKGNTFLQYFGLDNSLIDGIFEKHPYKIGLRTVGTNIPIVSDTELNRINPDYIIILAWHFISEFKERESEYLQGGGKFIVTMPSFEIITA